ncbi:MAG: tetratricopeptide repeat-containing glycosyltransferase family protein [Pseudomonadota bacterium]
MTQPNVSIDKTEKPQQPRTERESFRMAVEAHKAGDNERAAELYRICLAHVPTNAVTWTNFGALMRKMGFHAQAIALHRRGLELDPTAVNIRSNLANALCDIGEAAEAIAIREQLCVEDPDSWERVRDLAIAYRSSWRNQDAVDLIDRTIARLGPFDNALLQRSLAHLMLGNWAEGFADFENRYSGDEVSLPKDAPWPRWEGQDLNGKRLLVLPEQGFGDAILMARFLPQVKEMGAHVSMVAKPPLRRLFAELEGVDTLLEAARKSDKFDYYTPNMSLPHRVGMPNNSPPPLPRLSIPQDSRERAERIVKPFKDRFKVGIVWTGSLSYRANHRRSTSSEGFLDLSTVPGVQLFSLYKGDAHADFLSSGMAGLIVDACGSDRDFGDTAAVIDQMDLMITTDTAVVHVAASLGKPIWNMLTWEGFWLYGDQDTTPWYPSMRLYRQPSTGDWPSVFADVERDLRALIGAPK